MLVLAAAQRGTIVLCNLLRNFPDFRRNNHLCCNSLHMNPCNNIEHRRWGMALVTVLVTVSVMVLVMALVMALVMGLVMALVMALVMVGCMRAE